WLSEQDEQKSDEHIGTIEVRGFKETTTDEVIRYFFQSKKRSGGGQIKSMEIKRKENKACITFEDAKVASRIIQRGTLTLEDAPLQICELLGPQKPVNVKMPLQPNKLLLRGLLPTTTPDCLRFFVEYISEQDTFDIVYGPQPGVILVTFQEKIDFGIVQKRIQKKKNKQTSEFGNVDAAQVYFPSAVQVHGLPPSTTKDALEIHLEAQCDSDAHAEVIQLNVDKGYGVVEFSDYRDIGPLLTKEHRIAGQVITLHAYYPFFGETSHLPTSGQVIVKVNPAFVKYVQKHPQVCGRKFADVLEKAHAQAQFTNDGELRLSCTITDDAPDAFALIQTWEQEARLKVQDFFQHYSHEVFQIQPDAWNNTVERIAEKRLVESCGIILDMDPHTMKITLTGENEMVMLLSNQVKAIHDAEMKAIEREREKIKDNISLDEYKLRLLLALNFLNNMEEQFHDLSTKIDLKKGIISFEGVQADVRNAKLQMYERITTLVEDEVSLSHLMIDFLKSQACQDYLDQCLKSSQVVAVWTFGDKEISLYAQSRDQLETANAIILREIQEKTCELNAESQPLMKSEKWQKLCDSLNKDYPGLLKISSSAAHYTIVTLKKEMQGILGRINRFLEENTILTVFEPMEYGRVSYMKNYMIEGLNNITASLKPSVISVVADNTKSKPGIMVKGTKDGLKEIMPTIKELSSSVQKCSYPVGKPGMPKFFSEKKGQSLLEGVAMRTKTIIEVNQPEETTPHVITGKRDHQKAEETRVVRSQVVHSSGKKFLVCKGDMSKYPVDVVVNAANDRLEHTGGLAGALLKAGGKTIQEESKKFLESHEWSRLLEGQIAWTGPGKLPCKLIIHGVVPLWEGDKAGKERLLKAVVYKAFEKANQDGFKSIAFPAISSGTFGYPVDKSTRAIVEAADMSCRENPGSSLKEIHFVDAFDSTVDLFGKAVHSVLGVTGQFGQPKTRYRGSPTLREDMRGDDMVQWQDPDDIDTDDELQAAGAWCSRRTTQNTDFQPGPSPDSVETAEGITVTLVKGQLAQQQAFEDELQGVQGKGGMGAKPKRKRKSKAGTSEGDGSLYTNLTSQTPGSYQMKIGKICVQIQKDDITKEDVGAIVNSTNPTLDLSVGGVSKAIVNSGGSAILDECRKKGQTQSGLALTGAGKLKCNHIIHFDALVYFHGKWKEAVIKCLEMAESLGVKSVAFPALGTGALGFNNNPESIASDMLEGIADFYINVNPINVMLVRITLFQPHLLPIFHKVMKNKHGTPLKDNRGIFKKVWDTFLMHSWKGSEVLEREKKVLVLDIYAKDKKSSDAAVQGNFPELTFGT
ncbi:poly [ADP-ribose] polymerase 14-like, partial [Lingula anatina]|uniref:Poly [ADP-ribose] polymerase 14-like n=1 Tax=Lingula anatina TaxID=7574 RepID=A0A2R2MPV9_LINAN